MNKNERCLWIVGTFIDYGDMSLRELNARFLDYTLNYEGEEIQPRTFARARRYIASTFQIDIDFDPRLKKYHLVNPEEIQDNPIFKYLLGSIHVNNLSTLALRHKDKIMLQEIPSHAERYRLRANGLLRLYFLLRKRKDIHLRGNPLLRPDVRIALVLDLRIFGS